MSGDDWRDRMTAKLERRLLASVIHAAEQAPYPYDVRQADFQVSVPGPRVAWVVRIADPIPRLGDTTLPFNTRDVILRWPVAMYRAAVAPLWGELDFVDTFILAISDEGEPAKHAGRVEVSSRRMIPGLAAVSAELRHTDQPDRVAPHPLDIDAYSGMPDAVVLGHLGLWDGVA